MAFFRSLVNSTLLVALSTASLHAGEARVQWLLNFDGRTPNENIQTYDAQPANGEIAPDGGIEIFNPSAQAGLSLVRHPSGREVMKFDASEPDGSEGLHVRHGATGTQSRIWEVIIAPDSRTPVSGDWSNLISNNDAPFKGGNMELRLTSQRQISLGIRDHEGIYTQVGSSLPESLPADVEFTHVASVYDAEARSIYLYVNGEPCGTLSDIAVRECPCEPLRSIGVSNSFPGNNFTGYIDAVAESTFTGPFSPAYFALIKSSTPPPPPAPPARQVKLELPTDVMQLPRLKGTRHVVHAPGSVLEPTYHHGAIVTIWRGRAYVAWTATARDEHTPPYLGLVSRSTDLQLSGWSKPHAIGLENDPAYLEYMGRRFNHEENQSYYANNAPRCFLATPEKLYLWCLAWTSHAGKTFDKDSKDWVGRIFWTDDGEKWNEIPYEELDRLEKEEGLDGIRQTASNHQFTRLRDGRLMAYNLSQKGALWCPTTSDPTGLTGWSGGVIDSTDCADVGEPGGWQDKDGVLHGTARWGERIWHAYSEDSGKTWTRLAQQRGFSDCPGNKDFGMFPDGKIWYVGNPVPGDRMQLVLGISDDGWNFDRNYLVRWEPHKQLYPAPYKGDVGYQYPDADYHDGMLYVAYSHARDFIEITKLDVREILAGNEPAKP